MTTQHMYTVYTTCGYNTNPWISACIDTHLAQMFSQTQQLQLGQLTAFPHPTEEGRGDWLVILTAIHQFTHRGGTQEMIVCNFWLQINMQYNAMWCVTWWLPREGWSYYCMHGTAPMMQYMAASTQFNLLSQQIIIYVRVKLYILTSSTMYVR